MSNSASEEDSILYQEIANAIRNQFRQHEIDLMIRIYRRCKSDRTHFVKLYVLKKIHQYKKTLKRFRSEGYVYLHKGKEPYHFTRFGFDTGRAMLELRELGYL